MQGFEKLKIESTDVQTITVTKAKELLEGNHSNRPIRESVVRGYAEAMTKGQWRLTHQGIAIDARGNLVDGQHRLLAVIESGKPLKTMVTVYAGTASPLWNPVDIGAGRNAGDITGIPRREIEVVKCWLMVFYSDKAIQKDLELIARVHTAAGEPIRRVHEAMSRPTRLYSSASVRAAVVLRYATGYDWCTAWSAVLKMKYHELPPIGSAFIRRMAQYDGYRGYSGAKQIFALAWEATNPDHQGNSRISRESDRSIAEAKAEFEERYLDAMTDPRG